jgi:hypothetical protein
MSSLTKREIRRLQILEGKFADVRLLQFPVPLAVAKRMRAASEMLYVLRNQETGERASTAEEVEDHRVRGGKLSPEQLERRSSCERTIREGAAEIHRAEGYCYGLSESMRDMGQLAGLGVLRRKLLHRDGRPMTKGEDITHAILTARKLASEHTPQGLALRKANELQRAEEEAEDEQDAHEAQQDASPQKL